MNKISKKDNKREGFKYEKGKGKGREERNYKRGVQFNDVSWYTKNPSITKSFANLPFNYLVGAVLPIPNNGVAGISLEALVSFGVDWLPATMNSKKIDGKIADQQSILDQVATIIYTSMRRSNAGATNDIEYVDPVISNLLASIDILVNSVSMRRVFKIANGFSWKNRSYPRKIFTEHLGLDYDDFVKRQAEYRGRFNTLVALARTIKTLSNFPFVNAICAEFENIFKDSDTDTGRESLLIPVKYWHHIYDPVGTVDNPGGSVRIMKFSDISGMSAGTAALCTAVGTAPRKFEVDLMILEKQISVLINDGDFNLIQADLEKAFGEQSSYMVIDAVPDSEEPMKPIYSGEFMSMFHNGNFIPLPALQTTTNLPGHNITCTAQANTYVNTVGQWHAEDGGEIKMLNLFRISYYGNASRGDEIFGSDAVPLDSEADVPTDSDIVVMTRYKNHFIKGDIDDVDTTYPLSELPSGRSWNTYIPACTSNFVIFGGRVTRYIYYSSGLVEDKTTSWANSSLNTNAKLWQVKHRPIFKVLTSDPGSSLMNPIYEYQTDLNNIRLLSPTELLAIQQSCFLSLWDLPSRTSI